MARNTANVSFYCRESKKNKDGYAPIELSLVINGRRVFVQLPRKERPEQFKKEVYGRKNTDLKDYLASVRIRLNEIETAFIRDGEALTAEGLKEYFKTGGYVLYTVGDLFFDYMKILTKRVGKNLTPKTYRKYEIARDKFFKILPPTEPVSAITNAVILDYQASMNQYLDETVYYPADSVRVRYRSGLVPSESGVWTLSVSIDPEPRGLRGLGVICSER